MDDLLMHKTISQGDLQTAQDLLWQLEQNTPGTFLVQDMGPVPRQEQQEILIQPPLYSQLVTVPNLTTSQPGLTSAVTQTVLYNASHSPGGSVHQSNADSLYTNGSAENTTAVGQDTFTKQVDKNYSQDLFAGNQDMYPYDNTRMQSEPNRSQNFWPREAGRDTQSSFHSWDTPPHMASHRDVRGPGWHAWSIINDDQRPAPPVVVVLSALLQPPVVVAGSLNSPNLPRGGGFVTVQPLSGGSGGRIPLGGGGWGGFRAGGGPPDDPYGGGGERQHSDSGSSWGGNQRVYRGFGSLGNPGRDLNRGFSSGGGPSGPLGPLGPLGGPPDGPPGDNWSNASNLYHPAQGWVMIQGLRGKRGEVGPPGRDASQIPEFSLQKDLLNKELKLNIKQPEIFAGTDRLKWEPWVLSLMWFFHVKPTMYTKDRDKLSFAVSYLVEQAAMHYDNLVLKGK
ncbi:hypothetical protein GYMLUDRAFT_239167 [Collybiopsis luxurians FD-317 M1]|nr:hypothetical protein GYMLUDRAFT_239167 [Collybiopsis luxurians FD-317 M1]